MDDLVPSTDHDDLVVHGGRRVERKLAHFVLVHPGDLTPPEVDSQHLVLVGRDVGHFADHGRARGRLAPQVDLVNRLAGFDVDQPHEAVATGHRGQAVGDRRRAVHVAFRLHLPQLLAALAIQAVERVVVGTDEQPVASLRRLVQRNPGVDFSERLELPLLFAAPGVQRVDETVLVADVDDAVEDRQGRLDRRSRVESPEFLSFFQGHGVHPALVVPEEDDAAHDRGRALDLAPGVERPEQLRILRQGRPGHAGAQQVAAKHRPGIGGRPEQRP